MATPVQVKVDAKTQEADAKFQKFFDNFVRRAEEAKGGSKKAAASTEELAAATSKLSPAAKLAAGGFSFLLTAVTAIAIGVRNTVDAMAQLAARANITVTEFSAASVVFERAGVSAGELAAQIRGLAQKATQGNDALKQMEISVFRANGTWKTGVELLDEVADKFDQMPDGIEKTNLAFKLFGDNGDLMLKAMKGGAKGMKEAKDAAVDTGQAISRDLAEQVEKLDARLDGAKERLTAFRNIIATDALKLINALADAFLGAQKNAAGLNDELDLNLKTVERIGIAYKETIRSLGLGGLIKTETLNTPFTGGLNKLKEVVAANTPPTKLEKPAALSKAEDLQFKIRDIQARLALSNNDPKTDPVEKLESAIARAEEFNRALKEPIQSAKQGIVDAKYTYITHDEGGSTATRAYAQAQEELNKLLVQQAENNKAIADSENEIKKIQEERAKVVRELEDAELAHWQRQQELDDEWAQAEIERENDAVKAQQDAEAARFSNRAAKGIGGYIKDFTDGTAAINTAINSIDTALSGLADGITGMITGTLSWADAWRQTVVSVLAGIIQLIVKFTVLLGIVTLLNFLFPGSTFVSGLAGFAGVPLKPHAAGGYTGDFGEREPVGIVHGKEYVLNAAATRRIGLPALEAMNRGMALPRMGSWGDAAGARGGSVGGAGGRQIMIHPVVDEESARKRIINHPDMEHFIVNVVGGAGFVQA